MNSPLFLKTALFFSLFILLLSSCSVHRPRTDPLDDKKAESVVHTLRQFNSDLVAAKGTGWAKLTNAGRTVTYKIAWAARFPDRLRFTLLLSGLPVETVIWDGRTLSFISHTGEHRNYSVQSEDPDFKSYVDIPVKVSELIILLLGRLPVTLSEEIYFSPEDPARSTVVLSEKYKSQRKILTLDSDRKLRRIQMVKKDQQVSSMKILEYRRFDQRQVPASLELSDRGSRIYLEVVRFVPNPEIKESVFMLTPNGS